jgi:hypothetical protein
METKQIEVQIKSVLDNNQKFLQKVFNLSVEKYFEKMCVAGPSETFLRKYRSEEWSCSNPTRGWCGQMTRFLRDYKLAPDDYIPYCDSEKNHYYFINQANEVLDLTIYQGINMIAISEKDVYKYDFNKARFNPVKTESTKDAMKLKKIFLVNAKS